ncbi:photosystem II protein PsbQ [Calothrix sp. 336/3]|uniref:photosystem II protein PsbQ n=1 Tax=Calothrix sp. 336/3 TaxID=1337936 RepID=UPI0004E46FDD|nr:photosystem II protein PsbQ [Calothrix sp. 336/3]AKG22157.1 photosystem II protein PsbQ [Calothrix sp. 336/3]
MARQRSIFSLILVLLATFLISCGGPVEAKAPATYTPEQLVIIQEYKPDIQAVRDRSSELGALIAKKEWIKVGNFIHGPMAELRLAMNYVAPNLLPKEQAAARKVARNLFDHLVKIDQATDDRNQTLALKYYSSAFSDIDEFLNLLPATPETATEEG